MRSSKDARQSAIMRLISGENIATQEELTGKLGELGIVATQATVSRDIRELMLRKEQTQSGAWRYAVAAAKKSDMQKLAILLEQTVVSIDKAQNLIVIKTMSGAAHTAGEVVDNLDMPGIVGCIAGDNTCIVITRKSADVQHVISRLDDLIALARSRS
ncbi:MAG: arginine repressor [Oscillospiraceae bacterium]|jgi:transcriptional regulator of arginine metabolism|nr:arginine repressor [Oscillospiraceae bacterium]